MMRSPSDEQAIPKQSIGTIALAASVCAMACLLLGFQYPITDDDSYHLHSIWLVANGYTPYVDFFEVHLPGMWILLAPWAWLVSSPGLFFLSARLLMALLYGGTIFLAGTLIRANKSQALLLGLAGLLVIRECEVFIFRAEFLAALFVVLHLLLLSAAERQEQKTKLHFWAAVVLSLACTMTIRPLVFLPVQPILILRNGIGRGTLKRTGVWLAGLVLGAGPTLLYLSIHGIWKEAWFWCIRFASSTNVVHWGLNHGPETLGFLLVGLVAVLMMTMNKEIERTTRIVLGAAWSLAFLFHVANPLPIAFTAIHFYLISSVVVAAGIPVLLKKLSFPNRFSTGHRVKGVFLVGVVLLICCAVWVARIFPEPFDRQTQKKQIELLEWMSTVSAGEPVVLISPNHPIVAADATDLHNAWHYGQWMGNEWVRGRLKGLAGQILQKKPPVVCADPWMPNTGKRETVQWLSFNGVISDEETLQIRSLLVEQYDLVSFPDLSRMPFGFRFWVRRDRLEQAAIPTPHTVESASP
jgi:hypothetical protein